MPTAFLALDHAECKVEHTHRVSGAGHEPIDAGASFRAEDRASATVAATIATRATSKTAVASRSAARYSPSTMNPRAEATTGSMTVDACNDDQGAQLYGGQQRTDAPRHQVHHALGEHCRHAEQRAGRTTEQQRFPRSTTALGRADAGEREGAYR